MKILVNLRSLLTASSLFISLILLWTLCSSILAVSYNIVLLVRSSSYWSLRAPPMDYKRIQWEKGPGKNKEQWSLMAQHIAPLNLIDKTQVQILNRVPSGVLFSRTLQYIRFLKSIYVYVYMYKHMYIYLDIGTKRHFLPSAFI